MTIIRSRPSQPFLTRLRWALVDSWTMTLRDLQHWRVQPAPVLINWAFPIMILLMFGGLFGGAIEVTEGASYFEGLMPGMFTITMFFGLEATMMAVTTDAAKGITDRFRSMPMSASAVVLGRCIADLLNSMVGLAIMIAAGLLLGWRWHGSVAEAIGAIALLLFLRFALLWVGIYIGLRASGPEALTAVQILVWPVGFLSSIFVDPATMPTWLGTIAQWNPLSATASATRDLLGNQGWQVNSWAAENAVLLAIVWPVVLILTFMPLSVRQYRNLSR